MFHIQQFCFNQAVAFFVVAKWFYWFLLLTSYLYYFWIFVMIFVLFYFHQNSFCSYLILKLTFSNTIQFLAQHCFLSSNFQSFQIWFSIWWQGRPPTPPPLVTRLKLQISSHLLNKSLMKNFILCEAKRFARYFLLVARYVFLVARYSLLIFWIQDSLV